MTRYDRVVLIGFSGGGKSTVGRLLADRLGWAFVDTDAAVERELGVSVPEIFRRDGEAAFRAAERRALDGTLVRRGIVVACGGGAAVEENAWSGDRLGAAETLVVALDVQPATTLERLTAQRLANGADFERPLLGAADPLRRIGDLKAQRQAIYDRADVTLVVDNVAPADVAAEIAALPGVAPAEDEPTIRLRAPSGASDIYVSPGAAGALPERIGHRWPTARRVWLVTDDRVGPLHADGVGAAFDGRSIRIEVLAVPAGEGSKSLSGAAHLYDWMLGGGVERGDVVVALGGGVVGDLAGFAAATCLRGLGLTQVPTTLLAMVDSSVGGKTGINHAAGKNLIGAFYQPTLVVVDPTYLLSLPERELRSGWAEVVKHAVIQPSTPGGDRSDLAAVLARNAANLRRLAEPATTYLIRRNIALKAAVVEADEREAGVRAYLNFGHTIGHAIEAAGYRLLHGEAVALGMRAAARLGLATSTCGLADVERIDTMIDLFGLPRRTALDIDQLFALLRSDKKRLGDRQRWVLPSANGGVTLSEEVTADQVRAAVASLEDASNAIG